MNREQANKIVTNLLRDSLDMVYKDRAEKIKKAGYPKIADIFLEYITSGQSSRDFYKAAEDSLIVGSTKLGRSLK